MRTLSSRWKKHILDALFFMALYGWIAFIYMRFYYYESTAPTKYDAATGHIYQVNNHGYCFYLDKTQNLYTYYPLIIVAVFFPIAFILEWRWKIYKSRYEFRGKIDKYKIGPH